MAVKTKFICACGRTYKTQRGLDRHDLECKVAERERHRQADEQTKARLMAEIKSYMGKSTFNTFGDYLKYALGWWDDGGRSTPLLNHELIALRELAAERGKAGLYDTIREEALEREKERAWRRCP
jgi:hypothetical protein